MHTPSPSSLNLIQFYFKARLSYNRITSSFWIDLHLSEHLYEIQCTWLARADHFMRINGAMFQMSQTNPGMPVPNDHRYTQNIQDIIRHINNNKQIYFCLRTSLHSHHLTTLPKARFLGDNDSNDSWHPTGLAHKSLLPTWLRRLITGVTSCPNRDQSSLIYLK